KKGRGCRRVYILHPEALETTYETDPMVRPVHRRATYKGIIRKPRRDHARPSDQPVPAPIAAREQPRGHAPPRRWNAPREPGENAGVIQRLVFEAFDHYATFGEDGIEELDVIEFVKGQCATLDIRYDSATVYAQVESATYVRLLKGWYVPACVGSAARRKFAQDRANGR